MRAQVIEMLSMSDRPTAIAAKLPQWADDIAAIVNEQGLRVPEDVEIVFKGFPSGEAGKNAFPHVCPNISFREFAAIAGRMLAAVRRKEPLSEKTVVIPYGMHLAQKSGAVD